MCYSLLTNNMGKQQKDSIDAKLAFDGDEKSIARAIERSGASRALNLHFEIQKIKIDEVINFEDLNLSQVRRDKIFKMMKFEIIPNTCSAEIG